MKPSTTRAPATVNGASRACLLQLDQSKEKVSSWEGTEAKSKLGRSKVYLFFTGVKEVSGAQAEWRRLRRCKKVKQMFTG